MAVLQQRLAKNEKDNFEWCSLRFSSLKKINVMKENQKQRIVAARKAYIVQ